MTATQIETTLPAVQCTPWCRDGDGHTDAWHPGDQYCISESRQVALTRQPLIEGYGEGLQMLDFLSVGSIREHDARNAFIDLSHGDSVGVKLSPAEALELARVLTLVAGVVMAEPA